MNSFIHDNAKSRSSNLRRARVYLMEARSRRDIPAQRNFCFVLLSWAARCRLNIKIAPGQGELF